MKFFFGRSNKSENKPSSPRFILSKRQLFVLSVVVLTAGLFLSEFVSGVYLFLFSFFLSFATAALFYLAAREGFNVKFSYPVFILPFLYTLSFTLFYPLLPARILTRVAVTTIYAFGLYSLFLTQNIFTVSAVRTINLLRSARIVSFVITIVVLFVIANVIFAQRMPLYLEVLSIFGVVFALNLQSLWTYSLAKDFARQMLPIAALISFSIAELALALSVWPINAAIFSIFITGMFYAYSGLAHAWIEKRLFRNVLWEYVWVGFLAVLILIFFASWGI